MKKPESRLYYSLLQSTPFFHEKDFRNWLDGLKNYSSPEKICIYNNLREREEHSILKNPSCDLENYFVETLFQEEYFLEPLDPKKNPKREKDSKISGGDEKRRILALSQVEATLKEKLIWSTQLLSIIEYTFYFHKLQVTEQEVEQLVNHLEKR